MCLVTLELWLRVNNSFCIFAATKANFDYFFKKLFHSSTLHTYHHNSSWTIRQARNYLCCDCFICVPMTDTMTFLHKGVPVGFHRFQSQYILRTQYNYCFVWVPMANIVTFLPEGFPWVPVDFDRYIFVYLSIYSKFRTVYIWNLE